MKLIDILFEGELGTYAGVRFSSDSVKLLHKFCKDHKIPNMVPSDEFHTTLLYSKKLCPKYDPKKKYDPPLIGTPIENKIWGSDDEKCLVLIYDCDKLQERHKFLMKEHDATYDFPEYIPHVTLSYDIGDFDIKQLPLFKDKLHIIKEYMETLDKVDN